LEGKNGKEEVGGEGRKNRGNLGAMDCGGIERPSKRAEEEETMKVKKPVLKRGDGYWDIYINGKNVVSVDYDFGTIILFVPKGAKQVIHREPGFHTYIFREAVKPSPVSSHSFKRKKKEGKEGGR
jgi:hypothetical protein